MSEMQRQSFVVPLRKEIKDSLTRQGMQIIRGLNMKRTGRKTKKGKKRKEYFFLREHTKKSVKNTCTSFRTAATCHSGNFPRAR